jgi:sortase A
MRVLGVIGKVLIGAGVVVLLFTAYQVWGTSFQEGHTQNVLRHSLQKEAQSSLVAQALANAAALNKLPTGPPVVAQTTAAPAEGNPVGTIRIPRIGINQVVVEGTSTNDLRKGPGHYTGTPLPGQVGNAAIAGHRTTYGHPFYNLDALKVGDPIVITSVQGVFVYDTIRSEVIAPDDNSVLKNTSDAEITLTTCNPRFSASTRLIVTAKLAHSQLFANAALPQGKPSKAAKSNDLAGNSSGQVLTAVLWGLVCLAALGVILLAAYLQRRFRWAIYGVGVLGMLALLYYFFAAITPLLPASL